MDRRLQDAADLKSQAEGLQAQSNQARIDFLRTEVGICFTLAEVAEARIKDGEMNDAGQAMRDAETGYTTLVRFLTDPKHAEHIVGQTCDELKADVERLRSRLDGLSARLK